MATREVREARGNTSGCEFVLEIVDFVVARVDFGLEFCVCVAELLTKLGYVFRRIVVKLSDVLTDIEAVVFESCCRN